MWLKSHRWVDVPGTRTEKRWAMNVRESSHSAMVFDKRYLNIETGKFDTDKLRTLNSLSLNDLVDNYDDNGARINTYVRQAKRDREQKVENVYDFPKHVPKDNDFDEELRREKEWAEKVKQQKIAHEARLAEYEEGQRLLKEAKERYAKQLAETEGRLIKECNERHERLKKAAYSRHVGVGNVRPNRWIPK